MIHLPPLLAASTVFYGIRRFLHGRLTTEEAARQAWLVAYPGDTVRDAIPSRDGRSALVETDWGTGVICRKGRFARRLDGAEVRTDDTGIAIHLPDLETPRVHVSLTPQDAARWQERIEDA